MEKNLAVPYKSQHGSDSAVSNNDCGPESLAMVMEFLGKPHTVGGVLKKLGNPTGFTTISQLAKVAQDQGFNVESKIDATFQEIKKYIDKGLPVIVVGGYSYLKSVQDTNFKGSHIMVVCGYREDDSVYVNDPNFYGSMLTHGDHHVYTFEEFNNFWRNDGNKEGNQPNILFVVSPKPSQPVGNVIKKAKVTPTKGAFIRSKPIRQEGNTTGSRQKGDEVSIVAEVEGEEIEKNKLWYQLDNGSFIWSGVVEVITSSQPKEEPKKEETNWEAVAKEAVKQRDEALSIVRQVNELTGSFLKTSDPNKDKKNWWDSLLETLRIKK